MSKAIIITLWSRNVRGIHRSAFQNEPYMDVSLQEQGCTTEVTLSPIQMTYFGSCAFSSILQTCHHDYLTQSFFTRAFWLSFNKFSAFACSVETAATLVETEGVALPYIFGPC